MLKTLLLALLHTGAAASAYAEDPPAAPPVSPVAAQPLFPVVLTLQDGPTIVQIKFLADGTVEGDVCAAKAMLPSLKGNTSIDVGLVAWVFAHEKKCPKPRH